MTALALTLVLIAAVLHATWNLCAKRAGGGLPFVWLVGAAICTFYVPVLAGYWWWRQPTLSGEQVPLIFDGGTALVVLAFVTPFAIPRRAEVAQHWREHKRYVFGMAILSPIAYVLVLTAMTFTPVSYVAPAREVSIVIGAFIGARFLKEADGRRRIWAAVAMTIGVRALALG